MLPYMASAMELLSHIRYPLMHADYIHSAVEPVLSAYGQSGDALLLEAYRYHSLAPAARPKTPRTKTRFPRIPYGVQLSIPPSFLDGWTCQFDHTYDSELTEEMLEAVPAEATHVFVGARSPEGEITLGACGERDAVLQRTESTRVAQEHKTDHISIYTPNMLFPHKISRKGDHSRRP